MVILTVLRSGGHYDARWVAAMERACWKLIPGPHRFCCLTDLPQKAFTPFVRRIPLAHDWPGWWSKIELFRPGLFERGTPLLYLDLDSVVCRDLTSLATDPGPRLRVLRDFYRPQQMASGFMSWQAGNFEFLYHEFALKSKPLMARFRGRGDQGYIAENVEGPLEFWQDLFPDQVVSFKVHCARSLPGLARVVCFHGKPRPDQANVKWVKEKWQL